jgi:carboxyl-terminal processing protease
MRKWSTIVLVAAILVGAFFVVFHMRHHARQTITGIGTILAVREHALEIMGVLPDSPAAKAGLHRGLIIQQIDGRRVAGRPLAICVAMTRGPVGSTVQLEVVDPAKSETNLVELTRVKFSLPVGHGSIRLAPVAH